MSGRNLVVCLDGTNNEPERDVTNVARVFQIAEKSEQQLVYYDPGVGTMGARAAITGFGKAMTRFAGLTLGFGVRDNIEEAYVWLSRNYHAGDRIYVFGFSRGAYTARALTGMLSTVGLLRNGAENLAPYALKMYTMGGPKEGRDDDAARSKYWKTRRDFSRSFGNPDFPDHFANTPQVHYLGVWDTVKSVGWLNLKVRFETARWPYTDDIRTVAIARHALAIDENRRTFKEDRFSEKIFDDPRGGDYEERWFAGVHSDVGGQFEEHKLSDIAFSWIVDAARQAGLLVDEGVYNRLRGLGRATANATAKDVPDDYALGAIHPNPKVWWWLGGWRTRRIGPSDVVDPSVYRRIDSGTVDYRPRNMKQRPG